MSAPEEPRMAVINSRTGVDFEADSTRAREISEREREREGELDSLWHYVTDAIACVTT